MPRVEENCACLGSWPTSVLAFGRVYAGLMHPCWVAVNTAEDTSRGLAASQEPDVRVVGPIDSAMDETETRFQQVREPEPASDQDLKRVRIPKPLRHLSLAWQSSDL